MPQSCRILITTELLFIFVNWQMIAEQSRSRQSLPWLSWQYWAWCTPEYGWPFGLLGHNHIQLALDRNPQIPFHEAALWHLASHSVCIPRVALFQVQNLEIFKIPSNPSHFVIVWFHVSVMSPKMSRCDHIDLRCQYCVFIFWSCLCKNSRAHVIGVNDSW